MKKQSSEVRSSLPSSHTELQKHEVHSRVRPQLDRGPLPADLDFGLLNQYKLEDLINVQSDGFKEGAVVRVAFLENHSLHLEEDAIQLFEQYAKHEIALAAIFGGRQAGKSLLLDKILNLSEIEGSHFARVQQAAKGIYMWSIPFSRGGLKVFLLDIEGCETDSEDYHLLLSFLMFLASSLILLAAPTDPAFEQLSALAKQLKSVRKCFSSKQEVDVEGVWPTHLYCLYRSPATESKAFSCLEKMFARLSWKAVGNAMDERHGQGVSGEELKDVPMRKYAARKKILSESYLRSVSAVLRHLHAKIECKSLAALRFTGANLVKLAVNAVQTLNVKGKLALDRIARRSLKELYEEAYQYHTQLYNEQLAGFLADERPFELDYLIAAFKDSHHMVFKSFGSLTTSPELAQTYSDRLERYVAEKERMILAINKKKCASQARLAVPAAKPVQQISEFVREAKKSPKCLQQVYASEMVPIMANALKQVETQRKTQGIPEVKGKMEQIQYKIQSKESELLELKKNNVKLSSVVKESQVKKEYLDSKEKNLNEMVKKLKTQLSQAKTVPSQKAENTTKTPEQLRAEEQKLRKDFKAKGKMIAELKSQQQLPRSQEQIELLHSQIEQKVLKQRELMESAMASHIPKLQSIQTFRSNSKITTPRKVQSRAFKSESPQIRIISSPKA